MPQSVRLTVVRVDSDQHLVVLGNRPFDVLEPQNVGRPVPVVDDGPHVVTTIFPRA